MLNIKCFYASGQLFGEYKSYHRNGREYITANYEMGKKVGLYLKKDKHGKVEVYRFYSENHCINGIAAEKQRRKLNARLKQIDLQVSNRDLKRTLKRDLVTGYRCQFPKIKQMIPHRKVSKGKSFLTRAFSWLARGSRN